MILPFPSSDCKSCFKRVQPTTYSTPHPTSTADISISEHPRRPRHGGMPFSRDHGVQPDFIPRFSRGAHQEGRIPHPVEDPGLVALLLVAIPDLTRLAQVVWRCQAPLPGRWEEDKEEERGCGERRGVMGKFFARSGSWCCLLTSRSKIEVAASCTTCPFWGALIQKVFGSGLFLGSIGSETIAIGIGDDLFGESRYSSDFVPHSPVQIEHGTIHKQKTERIA